MGDVVEGRYRIINTLGEGGMGTVFLAEHTLIRRRVAIKILHSALATDAEIIERFMNEARIAGTLGHPNIVESTDMGFTGDHVPYIVFEYLEGSLLTDEIYRVGGLPVRRAARVGAAIASALHAAHHAGVVHRDLKSDNVFLTDKDNASDHVKVLDFGISRFMHQADRQQAMVMGTPEFMSPEQLTDPESVDHRTDVYALGVILYEMLTARRPFTNDGNTTELAHRIISDPPPPLARPEVPQAFVDLIMTKLLAKDPDARIQTMAEVENILDGFVTRGDGTPIPRPRHDGEETRIRPAPARDTPWPVQTLDGSIPTPKHASPRAARPYLLYGVAAGGIVMGSIGLFIGLRGGNGGGGDTQAPVVPPVAVQAPMPAPAAAMPPAPKQPEKIQVDFTADVADARVVFRRRVAPAPSAMTIAATDVVELVEVSAPGYKTTRYWLTFDRATHLKAHLVKGDGLVEATEEQTLVALGEVQAPSVAAATPKATATARPVEAAARSTQPTRKIGRSASAAPAIVASADPAPLPTSPLGAPAAVEPKLEAPPAAEPPAPTPAPPPIAPTPTPEPAPTVAGQTPPLDPSAVGAVVSQHQAQLQRCFDDGKKKDPTLKGTIELQLAVDAAGKVHRVQVQSTLHAPVVAACVVRAANSWRFPTRDGSDVTTVTYPLTVQ